MSKAPHKVPLKRKLTDYADQDSKDYVMVFPQDVEYPALDLLAISDRKSVTSDVAPAHIRAIATVLSTAQGCKSISMSKETADEVEITTKRFGWTTLPRSEWREDSIKSLSKPSDESTVEAPSRDLIKVIIKTPHDKLVEKVFHYRVTTYDIPCLRNRRDALKWCQANWVREAWQLHPLAKTLIDRTIGYIRCREEVTREIKDEIKEIANDCTPPLLALVLYVHMGENTCVYSALVLALVDMGYATEFVLDVFRFAASVAEAGFESTGALRAFADAMAYHVESTHSVSTGGLSQIYKNRVLFLPERLRS